MSLNKLTSLSVTPVGSQENIDAIHLENKGIKFNVHMTIDTLTIGNIPVSFIITNQDSKILDSFTFDVVTDHPILYRNGTRAIPKDGEILQSQTVYSLSLTEGELSGSDKIYIWAIVDNKDSKVVSLSILR